MQWLPYLVCPFMMLICMLGLFGGKKKCSKTNDESTEDVKFLKEKIKQLDEQNASLTQQVVELQDITGERAYSLSTVRSRGLSDQ